MSFLVEVFPGKGRVIKGWHWRLRGENGEVLAFSESYTTKGSAMRTAKKVAEAFKTEVKEKPYARH